MAGKSLVIGRDRSAAGFEKSCAKCSGQELKKGASAAYSKCEAARHAPADRKSEPMCGSATMAANCS